MKIKITIEAELDAEMYHGEIPKILASSIQKDLELGYIGFNDLKIKDLKAEFVKE